jgi:ABC-2 type transport system permease protein
MLLWLSAAAYMAVEVLVFRHAYPTTASRQRLLELSTSTAVRVMQGIPGRIDTAGGFAVWDGGWMVMIVVASWAMLTAVRLTRGEEDAGRAELVLSRPLTARNALAANLLVMTVTAAGVGAFGAVPFLVLGEPVAGAIAWAIGLALFTVVAAAIGALVAQVFAPRRRATAVGLALVALAYLLRAVANSAHSRSWLSTLSPFGWLDRVHVYGGDDWRWLLAPAVFAALVGAVAILLCKHRDTGAPLLRSKENHESRLRLLGGPARFGWRLSSGVLLAWTLTLTVCAVVFGLMTQAVVDFINQDDAYRKMIQSMGMDVSVPTVGFVSYIAAFTALPFAAFTGWRVGAVWQEESAGRLNNLLVRGVVRWRWLATTAIDALVATAILVVVTTLGVWAGAKFSGAPVGAGQVIEPFAGTIPVVVLFVGISVLMYGVLPQLTIAAPVTLAVVSYVLDMVGSSLKWPGAVVGISPFHHLAQLPSQPMAPTAIVVMVAAGLLAASVGVVAFARRDLRGG